MLAKTFAAFLLPALAAAQVYGPPPGPSTPTTSAAPVAISAPANTAGHININVGPSSTFTYSPANITAAVGTLITFYFPADVPHSVTQSSFDAPCTHLLNTSANTPVGFDSGLVLASTFTLNVTDTNPVWFHCRQLTHCGTGMVGSINAPTTGNQTHAAFVAKAVQLGSSAPDESTTTLGVPSGGIDAVPTGVPVSDNGAPSDATKVAASAGFAVLSAAFAMFVLA